MKKTILFLSIICAALFMTSCLGEVSSNYADSTFVYVDMADDGTFYGKTISPYSPTRLITNSSMILLTRGEIVGLTYSWDEAYGQELLSVSGESFYADNVQLSGDPINIPRRSLYMTEIPEIEDPESFLEVAPFLYADSKQFMGDKWIFQYSYEALKGKSANVEFYLRDNEGTTGNKIIIDINLSLAGEADGTTVERRTEALSLDMTPIRYLYEGSSQTETKMLEIEFKYYQNNQLQTSQTYRLTVAA